MLEQERERLLKKTKELEERVAKYRSKKRQLENENGFFNQVTQLFVTVMKVVKSECKYCMMMAQEENLVKKSAIMEGIKKCK